MTVFDKIDAKRTLVVGVGSALIDILAHEDDHFLQGCGAVKGGMTYVDNTHIDHTLAKMTYKPKVVPGGSACNTVVGIGQLGGQARFVGKCGNGSKGRFFQSGLKNQNVMSWLFTSDSPTGRVLSIITPDAQRSMLTYLGASSEAMPEEITPECFDQAAIVHIEGYLLFNPDLIIAVLKAARAAGALISLDLASFNVVEEAKELLPQLVAEYVDILIANEDEALAYTGIADERQAIKAMASQVDLAVLKVGARGSMIARNGDVIRIVSKGDGKAVDTTGAGDLWASGFLYGLIRRLPLAECGVLGSICGYEVCQVVGANIPNERWKSIRNDVEEQWPKNE